MARNRFNKPSNVMPVAWTVFLVLVAIWMVAGMPGVSK